MSWFDRFGVRPLVAPPPIGGGGNGPEEPPPPPTTTPTPPTNTVPNLGGVVSAIRTPYRPPGTPLPAVLEGWDPNKWADETHVTPKYRVGRILARYPPTVEGLRQAIPELQAAFPGLTFDGKDSITVPGLGPIDVLRGASNGGVAWQWIDITEENRLNGQGNQGHLGNQGVAPVAPYGGVGGGGVGGGGGTGGGSSSGDWSMPRGSDYQFAGVPGYTAGAPYQTGTQAGAFGLPGGIPGMPGGTPGPSQNFMTPGTPGFSTPGTDTQAGQPLFSAGPQSQTAVSPGMPGGSPGQSSRMETSDQPFGQFGAGQVQSGHDAPPPIGGGTPPSGGGYDRAPSYTPLRPFVGPDVPNAAAPWSGTAFDVGQAPANFVLPTGQAALEQDPGYQFRMDQGTQALLQNRALHGMLATGGTGKALQEYGQRYASGEYQNAVDRALSVAGFNETNRRGQLDLGLRANQQNNAFGLQGAQFNADQTQRNYDNRYTAANQGYAYANQQNQAGNAQALSGYQTDVGRDLGIRGLNLTASQNAAVNALNGQQQQWMQIYMQNGQSFDQAYRLMMARLQYPA